MFEHVAAIVAGYVFALFVGHWAIGTLLGSAAPRGSTPQGATAGHPAAIGLLERTLYLAAWQLGARWFIGLWLAVKVVGNWQRWNATDLEGSGTLPSRGTFNRFLLGAGASIVFAVTGALLSDLLERNDWAEALLVAALVVGAALGLAWFLRRARD